MAVTCAAHYVYIRRCVLAHQLLTGMSASNRSRLLADAAI
jgi:hypothetical protein